MDYEHGCLQFIAEISDGSMRDALSMLDQMICLCDNKLSLEIINSAYGVVEDEVYSSILTLVGKKNVNEMLIVNTNSCMRFLETLFAYLSSETKKERI